MTTAKCVRCGKPAAGFASINGQRFCHGDLVRPSCYERQNFDDAFPDNPPSDLLPRSVRLSSAQVELMKELFERCRDANVNVGPSSGGSGRTETP